MTTTRRKPVQRERAIQQSIVNLLRSMGAKVYVLGTTRRRGDFAGTMQTPGLPDLIVYLKSPSPARAAASPNVAATAEALGLTRRLLFIECKAPGGRMRGEQTEFRGLSMAASVDHVVGGLDDVIAWLVANGYLRADQVAHHHVLETLR